MGTRAVAGMLAGILVAGAAWAGQEEHYDKGPGGGADMGGVASSLPMELGSPSCAVGLSVPSSAEMAASFSKLLGALGDPSVLVEVGAPEDPGYCAVSPDVAVSLGSSAGPIVQIAYAVDGEYAPIPATVGALWLAGLDGDAVREVGWLMQSIGLLGGPDLLFAVGKYAVVEVVRWVGPEGAEQAELLRLRLRVKLVHTAPAEADPREVPASGHAPNGNLHAGQSPVALPTELHGTCPHACLGGDPND